MPDASLRFSSRLLTRPPGAAAPSGDASALVTVLPEGFRIEAAGAAPAALPFDEVAALRPGPYRVEAVRTDGSSVAFTQLGYEFEAFLFQAYRAWNAYVADALFVDEPCAFETTGDYSLRSPASPLLGLPAAESSDAHGDTRFRVHASSLLVLPLRAPVVRIPLCFVQGIRRDGFRIEVRTDGGALLVLSRLGHDTDAAHKVLVDALEVQAARALALLKEVLAPAADAAASGAPTPPLPPESGLAAAAWLLREGRAAAWDDLERACPGLGACLDDRMRRWSAKGCYAALRRLAEEAGAPGLALGIRREQGFDAAAGSAEGGDAGEGDAAETGAGPGAEAPTLPAFWLAAPIPGDRPFVAVEAVAGAPLAQATYLFDLPSEPAAWPAFLQVLGEGLEAVDFRRQPLYFPLEKLRQPAYRRDAAALRFVPALPFLRTAFRKRLMHADPARWEAALRAARTGDR